MIDTRPSHSFRPRLHDEDGITLVEVLVAIVILTILLGGLAQSLVGALRASVVQEARVQGTAAANALLEDVRVVDYDRAVFCRTEAEAEFGAPLTVDGEEVVVVPDDSALCDGDPTTGTALPPTETVTRGGFDFQVRRILTWVDDDADGLGASDADGPRDYKRLQVELEWVADGRPQTLETETRRAPEGGEQMLTTFAAPRQVHIYDEDIFTNDGVGLEGVNSEDFVLRVFSTEVLQSVSVSWVGRRGVQQSPVSMTNTDGGFTFERTFRELDGFAPFTNGETLFTFDATDIAGNSHEETVTVLFLQDLELRDKNDDGTSRSPLIAVAPARLEMDGAGVLCQDVTVSFGVEGILRSDSVVVSLADPSGAIFESSAVAPIDPQLPDWGANYSVTFDRDTPFPRPNETNEGGDNFSRFDIRLDVDRFDGVGIEPFRENLRIFEVAQC